MTRWETKRVEANDVTWDLQHTSDSYESLEGSLIPSQFILRSVLTRYDEGEKEIEELRSTTNLRQRLKVRREIRELNRRLQERERREDVNVRDKLIKQWELVDIDKKLKDMQAKIDAMEK